MAIDIFSSFDDHNKTLINFSYLLWILPTLFLMPIIRFSPKIRVKSAIILLPTKVLSELIKQTLAKNIGGAYIILTALILNLITLNLTGLVPNIFRTTSHLAVTLSLALPFWLRLLLISISYNLTSYLAHLQPLGAPAILSPFLCIIELVRILVRPFTLAVRLTANLSTGHILLALLGTAFTKSGLVLIVLLSILGLFYVIFEIAVCLIQAYIFTLLTTLYANDHPENH